VVVRGHVPRKLAPLLAPRRYKGAYGGRGGAKSHFFAEQIVIRCYTSPTRVVCIREVQKSIRDSVRQLLVDKIDGLGLSRHFEILDAEIRGPGGSLIIFRGMQSYNADSIKSLEGYDIVWVEEAQTLSQYSLDLLRPTIRKAGSEIWCSWNPRHKTDPVDQFFRRNPPADAISVQINWRDNPWFPDVLKREMEHDFEVDPDKAEHIWEGAYGSSQGAILARWVNQADRDGRIHDGVVYDPQGTPVDVSCDIGYRDTASWWYWQRAIGGYRILHYEGDSGLDADDWIPRIRQTLQSLGVERLGRIWLPHDARAKTFQSSHTVAERFLSAFGGQHVGMVPVSKKHDQISAARAVIGRCAFHSGRCEDGLDGLRAWEYEWLDEANTFSREPVHNWASHPSDAFAYGCQVMQMDQRQPEPPQPKTIHEVSLDDLWADASRQLRY
jgi:phage terminase large subunit